MPLTGLVTTGLVASAHYIDADLYELISLQQTMSPPTSHTSWTIKQLIMQELHSL